MAVEFGSNFISGVTTATSDTDVAYKQYADNKPGYALTTTAVGGEFYKGNVSTGTTTVGLSSSFEYETAGCFNYPIDSSATSLSLYITGSGGGGSESSCDFSLSENEFNWGSACFCGSEWGDSCRMFASNETTVMDASRSSRFVTTSFDGGLSWTTRTIPVNYPACSLTHANGLFVYGTSYGNCLVTSTDAIHWTLRTAGAFCNSTSVCWLGAAYGDGLWFASGSYCNYVASTDAIHWTLRTVPKRECFGCSNVVAYGNGVWLDFATGAPRSSTDTIHWTLRTTQQNSFYAFNVKFRCGEFFAVDRRSGSTDIHLQKSTDTIHWEGPGNINESRTALTGSFRFLTDIELINNGKKYLVSGDCSHMSSSTDFLHWKTCRICDNKLWRTNCCSWNYCFYSLQKSNLTDYPDRYFMSGYGYNATTIADIKLTGSAGFGGAASQSQLYNVSLENVSKKEGLTVCIGSGGQGGGTPWDNTNYSSVWKQRTALPNGCRINGMTFNDGKFVGVGDEKVVINSTDAIHWTKRTLGDVSTACNLGSVIYDCNHWLVTGRSAGAANAFGSLSASTDSIHWTQRTTGIPDEHREIIYHDVKKTYFMNSLGCSAASSTDAIHWTLRTIGLSTCSCACGSLSQSQDYYVVNHWYNGGELAVSTDAIHWKARTTGTGPGGTNRIYGHGYIHPQYIVYVGDCRISTSTDTIHWTARTATSNMDNTEGDGLTVPYNMFTYLNGELYYLSDGNNAFITSTSTDAIHWQDRCAPTGISYGQRSIAYGNGKYVATHSEQVSSGTPDFCLASYDAGATSGCDTFVRWHNGFPANARGSVYPITPSTGGCRPNTASAAYCFDPIGSEAAVLEYKSTDFRLSDNDTTEVGNFTIELWFRVTPDGSNVALQTLFALGEFTENGFLTFKYDLTNSAVCYYYKDTTGTLQSQCLTSGIHGQWKHIALEYDASTKCFSRYADGNRSGQYNASSYKPVVYGNRLRIGSLYNTDCSLTSLINQGAFNGEITNFRISNNLRYNASSYTVPTPDFALDTNTVFLTGRGESLNGSSGSCSTITVPGASGGTFSGGGKAVDLNSSNQSLYSNITTGTSIRYFVQCDNDHRNGLSSPDTSTCYSHNSTGGGSGALSTGTNMTGGQARALKLFGSCGCCSDFLQGGGFGKGGRGGNAFYDKNPGTFTSRTVVNRGMKSGFYMNGYYVANTYASTDTIHWTRRTVPFNCVTYGGDSYSGTYQSAINSDGTEAIMYMDGYRLYHTTDSIHWKIRTTPFGCNSGISCYVFGVDYMSNGEWSVAGCGIISISTDTIHWLLRTAGGCSGGTPKVHGVVYGNNTYLAAGHCCSYIATSTDSIVWTLRTRASNNFNSDSNPYTPAYGNGMFVVTGYASFSYSTDGISWVGNCVGNGHYKYGIRYHESLGQFYSLDYYDKIWTSKDGKSWTCTCVGGGSCSLSYFVGPLGDKMFYSNSCTNYLGYHMVADLEQGFYPGLKGNTGAGGGGGSYYSPTKSTQKGGSGGDGYVRINWK